MRGFRQRVARLVAILVLVFAFPKAHTVPVTGQPEVVSGLLVVAGVAGASGRFAAPQVSVFLLEVLGIFFQVRLGPCPEVGGRVPAI